MITVVKHPHNFSPAENPIVVQCTSDDNNLVYFMFQALSGIDVLSTLNIFPTPDNPTKAFVDLSGILRNVVKPEMKGYSANLIDTFTKPVFKFNFRITEMINNAGTIEEGAIFESTAPYYVYPGSLDQITYKNYLDNTYVINSTELIKFLTLKPDKILVNEFSNEGLTFLQDNYANALSVQYEFFDVYNNSMWTETVGVPNQSSIKQYRINCSPAFLQEEIAEVNFDNVHHYTVKVVDSTSTIKSETRTFNFGKLACHLSLVNIVWVNKFGALDTVQLYQPDTTVSVARTNIKQNQFRYDDAGEWVNQNGGIFNVVDRILSSTTETQIRLNTAPLSDLELLWLSGILNSRQIYIQNGSYSFVPVTLVDTSFNTLAQRFNRAEPNMRQLIFKLSDGFTPDVLLSNLSN